MQQLHGGDTHQIRQILCETLRNFIFEAPSPSKFVAAGGLQRPPFEFRISVHFRWGDVATGNSERPNGRAGGSLRKFAFKTAQYLKSNPGARVFFFQKDPQRPLRPFKKVCHQQNCISTGRGRLRSTPFRRATSCWVGHHLFLSSGPIFATTARW